MGLGRIGVGLSGLHSFILLWAGLKPGTGDTVVPPKAQAHSSEGDPAGMAVPDWAVILGRGSWTSLLVRSPLPAFPPHPAWAGLRVEGVQCPHGSTQHGAPGVFSWLLGGDLPTLYPTSAALILTLSKTISLSTIIPWGLCETTGSEAFLRFP